ncbi:TetR/AcrR family transcriptional regulator [Cytobacillus spongiae]|uniref:TetR/AcrR family transcriptional regulator n=1 Tax=Cytobacillus spongiae TaxID=2901381 RepID=UPI001F19D96C|nr:TetR/AcrR family transcriptional regulator [Cytobacillus spongiae]UII54579.1 TetR/AcrR family transcriptional regulator [Cytobacillus spongiae]
MSKGEETRENILKQALFLFSTKGYEETSLKDIAMRVNIKAPSIYAYFSSKEELFEHVTNHVMEDYLIFVQSQSSLLKDLSIEDQLYVLMEKLNKYFYEHDLGLFIKRYGMVPPERFKDFMLQKYGEMEQEIRKLLNLILEPTDHLIDKEIIATSFLCMLDGMIFYLVNLSEEEYERRLEESWYVFWRGISK